MITSPAIPGPNSPRSSRRIPPRSDSLKPTSPHAVLVNLDDELRDAKRVQTHGQEEDLKCALELVIKRVEELSSVLKDALKTQAELEIQLNLTKSNLQLVSSNNEMLEEALKRDASGNQRDLGWRRFSAREAQEREREREERRRSADYGSLNEKGTPTHPPHSAHYSHPPPSAPNTPNILSPAPSTAVVPPTPPTSSQAQDSRFFKFRFTSGTRSPTIPPQSSPLTSSSLPSLVSSSPNLAENLKESEREEKEKEREKREKKREKEIEDLHRRLENERKELETERAAHKRAEAEKAALEAELESLSQALFEEANKMVAVERIKRAETEEELRELKEEKEALREALRIFADSSNTDATSPGTRSRSSSVEALKSPRQSPPSQLLAALADPDPSSELSMSIENSVSLNDSEASFESHDTGPPHFTLGPAPPRGTFLLRASSSIIPPLPSSLKTHPFPLQEEADTITPTGRSIADHDPAGQETADVESVDGTVTFMSPSLRYVPLEEPSPWADVISPTSTPSHSRVSSVS